LHIIILIVTDFGAAFNKNGYLLPVAGELEPNDQKYSTRDNGQRKIKAASGYSHFAVVEIR